MTAEEKRVGLLIVGASGGNGRAIADAIAQLDGRDDVGYGLTSLPIFDQTHFPSASQFVLGGWDVRGANSDRLEPDCVTPGLWGHSDTRLGDERSGRAWTRIGEAREMVAEDIRSFADRTGIANLIVLNMSSPARRLERPLADRTPDELMSAGPDDVSSALAYALGAIDAGASFVDFTPSETLESTYLWELAEQRNVQVAGRDGSTGQTFLKALIASALEMRGLHVTSWYSTNILGNRDGQVLMLPGVDVTKQEDKAHALRHISDISREDHLVDIRYMAELGDHKEAWDSIVCRDMLGNPIELRLNWKALDSPLAAQLALDLARMIAAGRGLKSGLRRDLAVFFKHPVGGVIPRSPMEHLNELIDANVPLLKAGLSRRDLPW